MAGISGIWVAKACEMAQASGCESFEASSGSRNLLNIVYRCFQSLIIDLTGIGRLHRVNTKSHTSVCKPR